MRPESLEVVLTGRASRRQEIHETFIRHVAERGYDRTNFSGIARELGVSTGTIVYHFHTKAQMLRELEENYMRGMLADFNVIWDRLGLPEERVTAVIFGAIGMHAKARDATVAFSREVTQLATDPAMAEVRKQRGQLKRMTHTEVVRGVELGRFREVDAQLAVQHLWSSVQWMWVWFDPKGPQSAAEVAGAIADVYLGGLLADRFGLAALVDPAGHVASVVRQVLSASDETGQGMDAPPVTEKMTP